MKYRDILDEVQPKVATAIAIASVVAAAASAYGNAQAQKKAKRNSMNANQLAQSGGGSGPGAPTAYNFTAKEAGGGARLGDFAKSLGGDAAKPATESQQGFSLGMKSLDVNTPAPKSFEDTHAGQAYSQQAMPATKIEETPQGEAKPSGGGDTMGTVGSAASTAMDLYDAYKKLTAAPPPGPVPQAGPMNTTPTAYRFGLKR